MKSEQYGQVVITVMLVILAIMIIGTFIYIIGILIKILWDYLHLKNKDKENLLQNRPTYTLEDLLLGTLDYSSSMITTYGQILTNIIIVIMFIVMFGTFINIIFLCLNKGG